MVRVFNQTPVPLAAKRRPCASNGALTTADLWVCDLTHLSMRVGLYLHPRGMLAIQSLRLPQPFRAWFDGCLPTRSLKSAHIYFSHVFNSWKQHRSGEGG